MLGHELAVEQSEIADLEPSDEPGQRDFGRIARPAEHALAEECATELHSVEAADQLAATTDLDGMGVTGLVQRQHRALELPVDPRLLAVGARGDHRCEVVVVRDLEPPGTERAPERAREVEAIERQDRAVARLDPEQVGGLAAVGHGEDAGGITLQQQARVEATHCAIML
jgi:hypothetical protein